MTADEKRQIDAVERDRREREDEMLLLLLLLLGTATSHAIAAVRLGADPSQAARNVLLGNPALDLGGLATPLARVLATSYTDGVRRTDLMIGTRPPIVPVDPARVAAYQTAATQIVSGLSQRVTGIIAQAVSDGREAGIGTRKIASSIRDAMKAGGYLGEDASILKAVTERAIVDAHGAGMWGGWKRPENDQHLVGFIHRSVIDSVTTTICRQRNGFTRPKDDPYWEGNWPSLHHGCRSVVLPVFKVREWSTEYPTEPPMPGFGRAPWMFGNAWAAKTP